MADVYLDNQKLDFEDPTGEATVGDFLGEVTKSLGETRRLMVEVKINGEIQADWHAEVVSAPKLSTLDEMRIATASLDAVVASAVDTCIDLIAFVSEKAAEAVASLRAGSEEEGFDALASLYAHTNDILKTADGLRRVAANYSIALEGGDEEQATFTEFLSHLSELKEAKESGDTVLIADLVEYEITPLLEKMKLIYEKMLLQGEKSEKND